MIITAHTNAAPVRPAASRRFTRYSLAGLSGLAGIRADSAALLYDAGRRPRDISHIARTRAELECGVRDDTDEDAAEAAVVALIRRRIPDRVLRRELAADRVIHVLQLVHRLREEGLPAGFIRQL